MEHTRSDFGMIGLGVMGASLARNVESRGFQVSVYNRSPDKTDEFMEHFGAGNFVRTDSLEEFAASLQRPKRFMLLVQAGPAVDAVIASMLPHLEKGDIIIDGGNSFYKDSQRRESELKEKGIHFVGCGVSGGEEGALKGPSIMPGGSAESWKQLQPILEAIAAKDFSGGPCVTHVGPDGAGHYVKMVHNGIEYGIMQLIAESYDLLRTGYGMTAPEIADVFAGFTKGKLSSYLFDIAVPVLRKQDDQDGKDGPLINRILDAASNKGTGTWTSSDALDRGVAIPTITAAVYARYTSSEKDLRTTIAKLYPKTDYTPALSQEDMIATLEDALYAAVISTFAQGYALISLVSAEEGWNVDLAEVSRIWEGGCIIRATLLSTFQAAFTAGNGHLFALPHIVPIVSEATPHLRSLIAQTAQLGIALPAFYSAVSYIDAMTTEQSSANILQGLRDYFGAHTFKRNDMEGTFHAHWE